MNFINILNYIQFLLVICVRAFITPCLRSSGVENPALLVYVRAESRTLFMFERSREPCSTLLPVYVRAFLTQCLRSSGVENFLLGRRSREPCATCLCSSGVENPALLYSLFMFERSREPSWHHVYVRAESRTLFTFEPFWLLVYVRAESRTLFC